MPYRLTICVDTENENEAKAIEALAARTLGTMPQVTNFDTCYDEITEDDFDPENIYGLASMRQSIEEDRK